MCLPCKIRKIKTDTKQLLLPIRINMIYVNPNFTYLFWLGHDILCISCLALSPNFHVSSVLSGTTILALNVTLHDYLESRQMSVLYEMLQLQR